MATLTDEQRRALRLLGRRPNGYTEAIMLAHGFEGAMLGLDGLAKYDGRYPAGNGRLAADHRGGAEWGCRINLAV
jgi:hypothetical protein